MKRTLRILRQLFASYFAAALMYRLDFIQSIIGSLMWSGLSFASALLITSQTPGVPGMERSDLLLLAAAYGVIVGSHHLFCSSGFSQMSEIIHKGELDGYLLKPFDTITFLSLRRVSWGSSLRVVGSVILLVWLLHSFEIPISLASAVGFITLAVFSFLLIYSLFTMSSTVLIWHPYLSNIYELVQSAVGTGRYPLDIRRFVSLFSVLIFLPFLLIVNIPLRALTGRLSLEEGIIYSFFCAGIWLFSRWFWSKALRSYTGASG